MDNAALSLLGEFSAATLLKNDAEIHDKLLARGKCTCDLWVTEWRPDRKEPNTKDCCVECKESMKSTNQNVAFRLFVRYSPFSAAYSEHNTSMLQVTRKLVYFSRCR